MFDELGKIGVWRSAAQLSPELAVTLERLGYGAIWIGGSPSGDLRLAEQLLDATTTLTVATGIVNIWKDAAEPVAASYHRIEARHPGRFLLGIGVGHPEAIGARYARMRLVRDPEMTPIKASEVALNSLYHVLPEGIDKTANPLEEKAKAAVVLICLPPEVIKVPKEQNWSVGGIVAYSKICTHVGCPVGLYEHRTHLLLCPCHQSTFDVAQDCKVIFGPANRPLPQLKITVDADGYLIAAAPFLQPVGPSFWERG